MKEINSELHRQRVSASLIGLIGEKSRRWKGSNAGYVAKHLWIADKEKIEVIGNIYEHPELIGRTACFSK
jgi:hypothetical protein